MTITCLGFMASFVRSLKLVNSLPLSSSCFKCTVFYARSSQEPLGTRKVARQPVRDNFKQKLFLDMSHLHELET